MDSKVSFFLQIFWKIFWHQLIRNSEDETSSSLETFSLKPNPPPSLLIGVTRLGEFSKFLATNFVIKVAQIFGNNLGKITVYHIFRKKLLWLLFGQYWQIRVTFNSDLWSHWSPSSNDDDDIEKRNAARRRMRAKPGSSRTIGRTFPTHFL